MLSRVAKAKTSIKIGVALVAVAAAGTLMAPMHAKAASSPRVETKEGPVKGFLNNGVAEFLGIPYAAPPVGDLRWQPPQSHTAWNNVLEATAYGLNCAQTATNGIFAGPANSNEDCLYLNVFAPSLDASAKEKLPVIVWIHGGGNIIGESNDYDASKLAAQGRTVVVTINYRLGLLGWLAHPALDAEDHFFADYGLLDQQFALQWVKRNIAEFGGDETNVTLGGQAAGSIDTEANVISPLAAGLFQRAIFQSVVLEPTPLSFAETQGSAFAVAAGCGSGATAAVAKCLRNLTVQQIMALQGSTKGVSGPDATLLIADGHILPSAGFATAFKNGQFNHVPVMNGTVQDEGNFSIAVAEYFSSAPHAPPTAADFKNYVTATYSGNAGPGGSLPAYPAGTVDKVLARYPLYAYPTPQLAQDAVETDADACASRNINKLLASQVPLYAYEFDDRMAPFYFPKMPGFSSLAYRTGDIQYLFPLFHGGPLGVRHELNKQQEQLSDELVSAWANFARTGNPNGEGNVPWPLYENKPATAAYLSENTPILSAFTDEEFSAEHKCDLWDRVLTY